MRLYKITYEGGGEQRIAWAGTQAAAKAKAKALKEEDCNDVVWAEADVPTDKPALLAWLNTNACVPAPQPGER